MDKPLKINGIGKGFEKVEHWVSLTLPNGIEHKFFITRLDFDLKEDGILGGDFFSHFGAEIDYKRDLLKVKNFTFKLHSQVKLKINMEENKTKQGEIVLGEQKRHVSQEATQVNSDDSESEIESWSDSNEESDKSDCHNFSEAEKFSSVDSGSDSESKLSENASFSKEMSNEIDTEDSESEYESEAMSERGESEDCYSTDVSEYGDIPNESSNEDDGSSSKSCEDSDGAESNVKISVPKQAAVYRTINVESNGVGMIPELEFSEKIFTISCVVEAKHRMAKIVFVNTSDKDVDVLVPEIKVRKWSDEDILSAPSKEEEPVKIFKLQTVNRYEKIKQVVDLSLLNEEEKKEIFPILDEFSDVFFLEGDKLEKNTALEHEIEIEGSKKPLNLRQYKIPFALRGEMDAQIRKMIDADLIEESTSPWNMPVLLVPKKTDSKGNKKYRLVVDLRRLNELIVQDSYPLPNIDEILGQLGNSQYFSTLDLYSGFYQLGLKAESRKYTSFSANGKKWAFKRLPMGLKNSPAFFSRMMTNVLSSTLGVNCLMYMDDIIIFGATLQNHNENLKKVLKKLRDNGLKLQSEKCAILRKECLFLGHRVNKEGIFPDESKFEAVKNFPRPKNRKQVRSFLGLTGYYRKFIKDYGKIAGPLNKLTSTNVDFSWGDQQEIAFEKLKNLLINPPVLIYPDFQKEFILTTDASGTGIGAVLSQLREGKDRPIAFASRALNKRELATTHESATEKELLAIVWAVKHFRQYLYGRKFTVYTDHQPLRYMNAMCNNNNRLMKYKIELAEFDFEVKYKQGKINTNADALSRMFLVLCQDEDLREQLLKEHHDGVLAGHRSAETTVSRIKDMGFTWPSIKKDAQEFVKKCVSCQANKFYSPTKMPLTITDTPNGPWEKVAMDIVGELPETFDGNKYILTIQDNFSKFIVAIPLPKQDAETVAKAFAEEVILTFGICKTVLTDQGQNFMSKLFKELCKLFGIKKIRTTAFRPQSNGSIERMHRSLKEYLRHFIDPDQRTWDKFLKTACFAHNTSVHSSTKFTPFELVFMRKANIPSRFQKPENNQQPFYAYDDYVQNLKRNMQISFEIARKNLLIGKKRNKSQFDKSTQPRTFDVGDQVQLMNESVRQGRSKKLGPQWLGPYVVVEKLGDMTYKIKMGRNTKVVHPNKLKHYVD